MELFRLDTAYQPSQRIKKFGSLVWAERYKEAGDFKLVLENDLISLTTFPLGCLVSHTDTEEVMIVENHEVSRSNGKKLTTIISGRSFETFTENRVTVSSSVPLYNGSGNALVVVTASLSPETIVRNIFRDAIVPSYASGDDVITNTNVVLDIASFDPAMTQVIKRGDVYSFVLELLGIAKAGIKNRRPKGLQTTLDVVVHDGVVRPNVVFYADRGDLVDTAYFWSIKGYKNFARVATHTDNRLYRNKNVLINKVGLERRTKYVEADDLEGNFTPGTATDVLSARAQGSLDENTEANLMSAKVTITAKPKFKIHYDVGDIVTAFGEFSISQQMRVTEHILTVDNTGISGYPSLTAI